MNKPELDFGNTHNQNWVNDIIQEVIVEEAYERIYPVREGDVVLDIGASSGPFTWSIMDKASKVIAIEPGIDLFNLLKKNTLGYPNVYHVNKALAKTTGKASGFGVWGKDSYEEEAEVDTISFMDLVNEFGLDKVDFLKTDCEGGEYSLFTDENLNYLKNNVRTIVGEWHLRSPELKVEFRYWRDKYLKHFPNFEVRSVDGVDIKWDLWNDHFIEYYKEVHFHISNET